MPYRPEWWESASEGKGLLHMAEALNGERKGSYGLSDVSITGYRRCLAHALLEWYADEDHFDSIIYHLIVHSLGYRHKHLTDHSIKINN